MTDWMTGYFHSQTAIFKELLNFGGVMGGVIQFIRGLVILAFMLGAASTLVRATGCVGKEAMKAHRHGRVSFRWLNRQLVGN